MSIFKTQNNVELNNFEKKYTKIINCKSKIANSIRAIKEAQEDLAILITDVKNDSLYADLQDKHKKRIIDIEKLKNNVKMEYEAYTKETKDFINK